MREIKFRGWGYVNRQWVNANGYYFDGINYWFVLPSEGTSAIACTHKCRVDAASIGQFTGLLDKNGNEIYEGDILRCTDGDEWITGEGTVFFENGKFQVRNHEDGEVDDINTAVEVVIGNIYDHPSLSEAQ